MLLTVDFLSHSVGCREPEFVVLDIIRRPRSIYSSGFMVQKLAASPHSVNKRSRLM